MPSPFPGMNPYLEHEDAWHNFHEQFATALVSALEPQLGPHYFAKVDERVYVHELPYEERRFLGRGDAVVRMTSSAGPQTATALAQRPGFIDVPTPPYDRVSLSNVEIRDRKNRRLITLIELLSPSNKDSGPDRQQYLAKRNDVLCSRVNFVEIDLLRGGKRMPLIEGREGSYFVLIKRLEASPPSVSICPIGLRERLPVIPIPLQPGDREPEIDLQAILHQLYDQNGYAKFIYDEEPPLPPEEEEWARSLVPRSDLG